MPDIYSDPNDPNAKKVGVAALSAQVAGADKNNTTVAGGVGMTPDPLGPMTDTGGVAKHQSPPPSMPGPVISDPAAPPPSMPGPMINQTIATGNVPLGDPNQPLPQPGQPPAPTNPNELPNEAGLGIIYHEDGMITLPNGARLNRDHPLYFEFMQQAGRTPGGPSPSNPTGAPPAGPPQPPGVPYGQTPTPVVPVPATGTPNGPATQATNAQTYSTSPGAAPTANTTNQGTQDVVRNTLLQRATQGTEIDRNDPNIRQQADAFAAAQERARRNAVADSAEAHAAAGMAGSGSQEVEERLSRENAQQQVGQFEAQLVGRELQNRRDEILHALDSLRGQITADQQMQMQRELAKIQAEIQRMGINVSSGLGEAELRLKEKLGLGGLNLDAQRLLLNNRQWENEFGRGLANDEMGWNRDALDMLLR